MSTVIHMPLSLALDGIGGFSAPEVADIAEEVVTTHFSDASGSIIAYDASELFSGDTITLPTVTAGGALTEASYTLISDDKGQPSQAIIPMAPLCQDPAGDTYGVGVLVADALSRGVDAVCLLADDVRTCDAGTGLLVALGAQFHDEAHTTVGRGQLDAIASVDTAQFTLQALSTDFIVMVTDDATAPAKPCCKPVCTALGVDPTTAGLGAAGGIGIALHWMRPEQPLRNIVVPKGLYLAFLTGQLEEEGNAVATLPHASAATLADPATTAGAFFTTGAPLIVVADTMDDDCPVPCVPLKEASRDGVYAALTTAITRLQAAERSTFDTLKQMQEEGNLPEWMNHIDIPGSDK